MKRNPLAAAAIAVAALLGIAGNAIASSIAAVEAQANNTPASLDQNPVITAILSAPGTVNGLTYTNWSFLVNDGTGSLDIFGKMPAGNPYVPTVGDAISASGTYSPFHQIPEVASLTAISQISTGNPVPPIGSIGIPALNVPTQPFTNVEYLWTVRNVTVSNGTDLVPSTWGTSNLSLTITDSGNNSMTLFYWPTSYSMVNANLFGKATPTGAVDITGFVSVFGTGLSAVAEFTPLSITPASPAPEPASWILALVGGACGLTLACRRQKSRR